MDVRPSLESSPSAGRTRKPWLSRLIALHSQQSTTQDADNISEIQKQDILAAYEVDDTAAWAPTVMTTWQPHPPQDQWGKSGAEDSDDEEPANLPGP